MKFVCEKFANQTLALSSGKVTVDSNGVVETDSEAVSEKLVAIGFEAIGPFKEEDKTELPVEAVRPYIPELHADLPRVEELTVEDVQVPFKKKEEKPRFKRNK